MMPQSIIHFTSNLLKKTLAYWMMFNDFANRDYVVRYADRARGGARSNSDSRAAWPVQVKDL